jgi:nitrile hydratase subunit beta
MRAMHDLGGLPAGPVERDEHDPSLAERRVDALMSLLMSPPLAAFNVDEMRRTIESLPREVYERHDYYERWLLTIESLLVEKGLLTRAEIEARVAALEGKTHD